MDYGMYISASGVLTAMYRQDVLSNNLANLNTAGFKPDVPAIRARPAARVEDGLANLPSNAMLERLGAGVQLAPNRVDHSQGALEGSSSPYDVAIQGKGFFVLRDQNDVSGDRVRLTRDGRFLRTRDGTLANTEGLPVLDERNRPINIPEGPVQIANDGTIRQGERVVAKMQVVDVPNPERLAKAGHGSFRVPADQLARLLPASGDVRQYHIEQSGVDEVSMLMRVTDASRGVDANIALIQQSDRLSDRAINTFGRVS